MVAAPIRRILRTRSAALALVASPARADELASGRVHRALSELAETFAIEIVCAESQFKTELSEGTIRAMPANDRDLEQYVDLLKREFYLYPPSLVKRSKLKRLVLCSDSIFDGHSIGGCPDYATATLCLNVTLPRQISYWEYSAIAGPLGLQEPRGAVREWAPSRRYHCTAFHHEFLHMLDYADHGKLHDSTWLSLDPRGGHDYGKFPEASDPRSGQFTRDFPGFLTLQCLKSSREDRAEVFSHLIVNSSYVARRAKQDPVLRAKVRVMKRWLKNICPEVDEAFWRSAHRLQRPGPDPAAFADDGVNATREAPPEDAREE